MRVLVLLLLLSIGGYAYYHNQQEGQAALGKMAGILKDGKERLIQQSPPLLDQWSRSFDAAFEQFDWSALPNGDALLNAFEQSLNQFKNLLNNSRYNKESLDGLSNSMDNFILKTDAIDQSLLTHSQQQRLQTLLQQANLLKQQAKQL